MWYESSVFYQFYPLGFCGAPKENDGEVVSRILKVKEWVPHLKSLNVDAVYFAPVFESDRHGYDTRDYSKIDCRLGTNADFADVCSDLKNNGIRVVLDGVFNHVGRGFWAFKDVQQNRENSQYKDWFYIDFNANSNYNDGFGYEGWEGHYDLVKLNLKNPSVVGYLLACVSKWIKEFNIDGIRLDVAYCLEAEFMKQLRSFCDNIKKDFLLLGEVLFGDYNRISNDEMLHSCTNYECYKGLHSSLNDMNLFEIDYSLNRQFNVENNGIYKNKHFMSFVDNHDVTRVSSILKNKKHLPLIYGLLFAMPGIPCIYYGSEWGIEGVKENGTDDFIRPSLQCPQWNDLTDLIEKLAYIHKRNKALIYGGYKTITITNKQLVFQREFNGERILVAINAEETDYTFNFNGQSNGGTDLLTGERVDLCHGYTLSGYKVSLLKLDY